MAEEQPMRMYWSYTEARRHKFIIYHLGDIRLPFGGWDITQVGVFVVFLLLMVTTRGLWSRLIDVHPIVHLLLFAAVPFGVAQGLGLVQTEDRNPLLVLLARLMMMLPAFTRIADFFTRRNTRCVQLARFHRL